MKKIVIVLTLILSMMIVFPVNNVTASLPSLWIELDDFDSYSIDDNNGINGNFEWETTTGVDGIIRDLSDKYLLFGRHGTVDTHALNGDLETIYFNTTDNHTGYFIKLHSYDDYANSNYYVVFSWYDNNGTEKVRMRINQKTGQSLYDVEVYNGNDHVQLSHKYYGTSAQISGYISWQYYYDNVIQYKFYYNSPSSYEPVLWYTLNQTAVDTSLHNETDYECNSLKISISGGISSSNNVYTKIYQYGSIDETLNEPTDTFTGENLASICANPIEGYINIPNKKYVEHLTESSYSMTIHAIVLPVSNEQIIYMPSLSSYLAYVNGYYCGAATSIQPYGGGYAIVWDDLNGGSGFGINEEQILFEFYCNDYVTFGYNYYWYGISWCGSCTGDTLVHSSSSLFGDGTLNGGVEGWSNSWSISPCWYYNDSGVSQPEPIPSIETIDQYEDSYAENGTMGWVEFYEWFSQCSHRVGDNPYIIYNLTGNGTGEAKIYRLDIVKAGDVGDFVYTTLITITTDYKTAYFRLPDYEFEETGNYFIELYNTSDYGLTYDDLVYVSRNIFVCESLGSGGYTDTDTDIFPTLSVGMGAIVGVIVTVFLTLSPMIISGSLGGSIQVPPILYAIMGAIGVTISTTFGWFPSYIFFFIVAIGIIMLVAMYMFKIRGQEG